MNTLLNPQSYYPQPKEIGGHLIRQTISFCKEMKLKLPISSHILIAISGGIDSIALSHLLVHFGRRIVPFEKIIFLHINHGWRDEESDEDENFISTLSKKWNVPLIVHRLEQKKELLETKSSWEALARDARKKIFNLEAAKINGIVFTAHHADDLAETLMWRFLTGKLETHSGGILFRSGVEIRPFLRSRKDFLKKYLDENNLSHRMDSTNHSDRFLRSRMRKVLMPEIEKIFPRAIEHLVELGIEKQKQKQKI